MNKLRTNLCTSARTLGQALDAIAPVIGQTTYQDPKYSYTYQGTVSIFCQPGRKTRWTRSTNTKQSAHKELTFQTRIIDLCRAAQAFQEALYAWPAFHHPIFTFKIRNFFPGDTHHTICFSISNKNIGHVAINELDQLFDNIANHTEGFSTCPSDPTWIVGPTTIGAPNPVQALMVQQILTDPQTGFVHKKHYPKVCLLPNQKEIIHAAQKLARTKK